MALKIIFFNEINALHIATENENIEIIQLLLSCKEIDINQIHIISMVSVSYYILSFII